MIRLNMQPHSMQARTSEDVRSLRFFAEKVCGQMHQLSCNDPWERLALQVADSEPIIMHALLSLSAYYEHFTQGEAISGIDTFALRHYNSAIQQVVHNAHSLPLETTVLSCLLFLGTEVFSHIGNRRTWLLGLIQLIAAPSAVSRGHRPFQAWSGAAPNACSACSFFE
jgi:hypothetical protein